jgi:hypothetical protein
MYLWHIVMWISDTFEATYSWKNQYWYSFCLWFFSKTHENKTVIMNSICCISQQSTFRAIECIKFSRIWLKWHYKLRLPYATKERYNYQIIYKSSGKGVIVWDGMEAWQNYATAVFWFLTIIVCLFVHFHVIKLNCFIYRLVIMWIILLFNSNNR